jgi:lipopolysaccharide transport system ATP-binding protein
VEGVSKIFCRDLKKSLWYGLQDSAKDLFSFGKQSSEIRGQRSDPLDAPSSLLTSDLRLPTSSSDSSLTSDLRPPTSDSRTLRPGEFLAVDNVSFELKRGECLGLIGRNGAGKTTLLKMLNGLIKPDTGRIEMRGRVGALIALGSGFNPILSGRENIYINGSVLGLSKVEIASKIDDIIDFAEIGEFIDAPVQSYSSGMQVRLGFAIATTLEPDILILDEILAVGDAAFRHKCYHRLNKILSNAAVILVSHSMDYISQICTSIAMMRSGQAIIFSDVSAGISEYNRANSEASQQWMDGGKVIAIYPPVSQATVQILHPEVQYGGLLEVEVEIYCEFELPDVTFSFTAVNMNEQTVMAWHTSRRPDRIDLIKGRQIARFGIQPILLHDGTYRWSFSISKKNSIEHTVWMMRAGNFKVTSPYRTLGDIPYIAVSTYFEIVNANNMSIPDHLIQQIPTPAQTEAAKTPTR